MGVCEVDVGGACEFSLVPGNGIGGCMRGGCRRAGAQLTCTNMCVLNPKASFLTVNPSTLNYTNIRGHAYM